MTSSNPQEDNDSIKILKNRLAKGEITIGEFNELSKAVQNTPIPNPEPEEEEKVKRSEWWYLLPLLFGLLGGLVAYFVVKEDNRRMANLCVAIGLVGSILWGLFYFFMVIKLAMSHY